MFGNLSYFTKKGSELLFCLSLLQALSTSAESYPMFIFAEGKNRVDEQGNDTPANNITYIQRKSERKRVDTSNSLDEFVLLWTGDQVCTEGVQWSVKCDSVWTLLSMRTMSRAITPLGFVKWSCIIYNDTTIFFCCFMLICNLIYCFKT